MVTEARQHPRSQVELAVTVVRGQSELVAKSRDISLGGMFLFVDAPPPYGTVLTLRLTFPGAKAETTIKATVRWTTQNGMGVQFDMMGARDTHALTELLRETGA